MAQVERVSPAEHIDELAPGQLKKPFLQMREVLKTAVARGTGSEYFIERLPRALFCPNGISAVIVRAADVP